MRVAQSKESDHLWAKEVEVKKEKTWKRARTMRQTPPEEGGNGRKNEAKITDLEGHSRMASCA